MTSYLRGLTADAGAKASYVTSDLGRTLAFGWFVVLGMVLDVTRGY